MTINGGSFQDPIDLRQLGSNSFATFFGDLTYTGGVLRGLLANGDTIATDVALGAGITIQQFDDRITFTTAAVPEPSTILSASVAGLVGLGALLRRRRTV